MNAHINFGQIDKSNMLGLLADFPQQFRDARQIGLSSSINIKPDKVKKYYFRGNGWFSHWW